MEEKQLEVQNLIMDKVERETEEAPTSDLGDSGILIDGKGEDQECK